MVSGLGFTWFYGDYSYNGQEKGELLENQIDKEIGL